MRSQLADSLEYLFQAVAGRIDTDSYKQQQALQQIRSGRIDPGIFARYYDLVFAIRKQDFTQSAQLINDIVDLAQQHAEFAITPYNRSALGDDFERFSRLIFAGYSSNNPMSPPDGALFDSHKDKLQQAIAIIREIDPAIANEIDALLIRIVVASHNPTGTAVRSFGGVTSFMTWGAIFINASHYVSLPEVVEFLVHETTHCILYGLGSRQPLLTNHPSETYPSPLRQQPRPMDGVYHATIVCARLSLFMDKWRDSITDDPTLDHWLEQQLSIHRPAFTRGSDVIRQHAKLSPVANDVFEQACTLLNAA